MVQVKDLTKTIYTPNETKVWCSNILVLNTDLSVNSVTCGIMRCHFKIARLQVGFKMKDAKIQTRLLYTNTWFVAKNNNKGIK